MTLSNSKVTNNNVETNVVHIRRERLGVGLGVANNYSYVKLYVMGNQYTAGYTRYSNVTGAKLNTSYPSMYSSEEVDATDPSIYPFNGAGHLCFEGRNNAGRDVEITFDIAELYTLREVTQSYVKVGAEPVGFNIKRKLYQALYSKKYEDVKKLNYLISDYNATASPENQIIPSSINTKDQ